MAQALALPDEAEFNSITLINIGARFRNDLDALVTWCRRYGLLSSHMVCQACNTRCIEYNFGRGIDERIWRCNNQRCKRTTSIRKGSFFSGSHLHLWQLLALTYMWSTNCGRPRGPSQANIMKELEIGSEHTVVDWNQFCRDVTVNYFRNHPEQLGGPGVIVEIDESLFSKRKNHVGRVVREQWVFGAYEPATKKGLLIPVEARDAATLLPIVRQWIAPGSHVHSDMWRAYNQIVLIPGQNYQHDTVNHTRHFVDPQTGVTTNHVEAMWSRAKAKIKSMMGPTNREMSEDYMAEFMWNQRFGESPFYNFWHQIASELYIVH
ncbi:uncharacterized protein LOC117107601 [Anneissia japonica]|uniref:uncharacterized protein LOC117107601 n=1 Tax=Anneissia japonica TaxID=1529436 RepID=UPI001425B152|nr:uncharacterized protein LOC117107601 [Anneissia japonica]